MKIFRLWFGMVVISFFIGFISCNSDKDQTDIENTEIPNGASTKGKISQIPESGTISGDTINLKGKFVVFYGPEEKEGNEELNIYKETIAVIVDSLKTAGDLPVTYTTVTNLRIFNRDGSTMVISRGGFNENKGVLVMDGLQPPTIKKGVLTIPEYHALIKKYFLRP